MNKILMIFLSLGIFATIVNCKKTREQLLRDEEEFLKLIEKDIDPETVQKYREFRAKETKELENSTEDKDTPEDKNSGTNVSSTEKPKVPSSNGVAPTDFIATSATPAPTAVNPRHETFKEALHRIARRPLPTSLLEDLKKVISSKKS